MENIIAKIEQFLLNNAWGVIIGGIIASIVGTLLCLAFKKLIEFLRKKLSIRHDKQKFLKYTMGFLEERRLNIPSNHLITKFCWSEILLWIQYLKG